MYSKTVTCNLLGLDGYPIEVEADVAKGLNAFHIVGLPDASIKEAKERVRSAIMNSGYRFPLGRITVNLAPAHLRKEGSQLDLAIAVSLLSSMGIIHLEVETDTVLIGELSLDGRIVAVNGALPMVISLREQGYTTFIIPPDNFRECSLVEDVNILPATHLKNVVDHINKTELLSPREVSSDTSDPAEEMPLPDFGDVKGQESLKRALEIAAAGFHNVIIVGPPGSGKTMSAMRIPSILPDLSFEESIECTKIYSVSGLLKDTKLISQRPFRSPHHTSSAVSLIGGGRLPKPGEISLAHNGVLFLDEFPEFSRSVIEVLRQPLESGEVTISRVNASLTYPSSFMLVASMNPCPCGYYGDPVHECTCSPNQIQNYMGKISNPILDRIDIHIGVEALPYEKLVSETPPESSAAIKKRVVAARELQLSRFDGEPIRYNSQLSSSMVEKYCPLTKTTKQLMHQVYRKYHFSARSFHKCLKLSRTIADLDASPVIEEQHLLEAIRYRSFEAKLY